MLEKGLHTYLTAQASLTTLVSDRFYPTLAPQDVTLPYVYLRRVDTVPYATMDGGAGLAKARIQFVCFDTTLRDAKALADALRLALDGFSGTMGTVGVQSVLWLDQLDVYDPDTEFDGVSADYAFMYQT